MESYADDYNAALSRRIREAVASVRSEIQAWPQEQAEARLSAALGEDFRVLGPHGVRGIVRHAKDPRWSLKHPIQVLREHRAIRRNQT